MCGFGLKGSSRAMIPNIGGPKNSSWLFYRRGGEIDSTTRGGYLLGERIGQYYALMNDEFGISANRCIVDLVKHQMRYCVLSPWIFYPMRRTISIKKGAGETESV